MFLNQTVHTDIITHIHAISNTLTRRKLPLCSNLQIDEDVYVSMDNEDVDVLAHFVHNSSTRSANIPRPGPSTNSEFARKTVHCRSG